MKRKPAVETQIWPKPTCALLKYIRPDSRVSEAQQREILEQFALPTHPEVKWYVEPVKRASETYRERARLARALRWGDLVVVADLHRLASKGAELVQAIREIRSRKLGTVIVEARKGRRSDCLGDYAEMQHEANLFYSGRLMTTDVARARGLEGAKNSPVTKPQPGRMPWRKMLAIVKVSDTMAEAVDAINAEGYDTPVSRVWLYREFKKRGIDPKSLLKARRTAAKQIQDQP